MMIALFIYTLLFISLNVNSKYSFIKIGNSWLLQK